MTLTVETTPVPGLVVVRLDVHEDPRGWFKEGWQRQKMIAAGLPDFGPVQHNVSFNTARGTTRGIHAEPWDKLVSVDAGRAFGAWVDLREGPTYGAVFTTELHPGVAVFVPRGVGNSYQTLADDVAYSYLVNDHWRPGISYPAVDLGDPALGIRWPIPLAEAVVSEKDRRNPPLADVTPVAPRRPLVLGAGGQLGRALAAEFAEAVPAPRKSLDIADPGALAEWSWPEHDVVLNAAAFTDVDGAETPPGRIAAWAANATGPAQLARLATEHRLTLVHFSTDYVFDGSREVHAEDEPLSPLGGYGQSKAAGDLAVATTPRHYVIRTSWVVGDGRNFVRTMQSLAKRGVAPSVVDDQMGRPTFTTELAGAVRHLLEVEAPYGVYNVTNGGPPMSWADLAREVFRRCGRDPADVTPVSTADYARGKQTAPRPASSVLDLGKLRATGFEPVDALPALDAYLS